MRQVALLIISLLITSGISSGCNQSSGNSGKSGPATGSDKSAAKVELLTKETFKEKIWDYEKNPTTWVYKGKEPAIIDFYADWCRPCRMVAPILDELARDYHGKIKIYKVDTQVERELAAIFQITSIPAFLYIPLNGQPQMDRGLKDKATFERIIAEVLLKN